MAAAGVDSDSDSQSDSEDEAYAPRKRARVSQTEMARQLGLNVNEFKKAVQKLKKAA